MSRNVKIGIAIVSVLVCGATAAFLGLSNKRDTWERSGDSSYGYQISEISEDTGESLLEYEQKYEDAVGMLEEFAQLSEYIIVVDISEQKEYVYTQDGELVVVYKVSTGASSVYVGVCPDGETDCSEASMYQDRSMGKSVWKVVSKIDSGLSDLYGPRLMRLDRYVDGGWTETEIALHGTNEPDRIGTPFSLGCVYHKNADIIELFDMIPVGTFVVAIE